MIRDVLKRIIYAVSPAVYKRMMFKKYDELNWGNLENSNAENEILVLEHLLTEDSVFFDVGSNIGAYLYVAEKHTAPSNIYGFEPIPALFSKLKKLFSATNLYDIALSNDSTTKEFKIPTINGVEFLPRATLNTEFKEMDETDATVFKVRTERIDDFVTNNSVKRVDLIKIDVEGHEMSVFEGATETIDKFSPYLIIEMEQRHHEADLNSLIDQVLSKGYSCYYFDIGDYTFKKLELNVHEIQKIEDHKKSRKYVNNFMFLPEKNNPELIIKRINESILDQI